MSDEEEGDRTYTIVFEDEPDVVHKFLPAKDGKALATWPNGDTFEGFYKDGKRTGKGVYKLSSGASYDGDYIDNKKEGFGVYISPDGGKYTGEWLNDKRHGQGTYKYPSGDSYTGLWKNGAKHGRGSYLYKGGYTSITGVWSNGQVVDGSWTSHDGSKYMGAFLNNLPAGEGIYVHSSGNTSGGLYADGLFKADTFRKPHPNTKPPESKEVDSFKKACRAIDKAVTKVDHFNTMFLLKPEHDGVPNFRRVGTTPVFGSAQPTVKGLKKLAETLGEAGVDKTNWISLREDAVLYITGVPLCPRDRKKMDDTLVLPGIDNKMMIELENRLAENVKFLVKKKGNLHDYFEDEYDPVNGSKATNKKTLEVKGPDDIKPITSLYQFLAEEEDTPVSYLRCAMSESGNPTIDEYDRLHSVVRKNDGSAMVFHDANGGDRVTTAQVLALLILNQEGASEEGEEEAGGDGEGGEGDEGDKKEKAEVTEYNPDDPDLSAGQYSIIMKLVAKLNGEETADEKAKREEEEESAKETKVAEAMKAYEEEQRAKEEAELAAQAAAAEANEGDEGDEKPADEAPTEGEEAAPEGEEKPEEEAPPEKTLEERIEEAKASVPCGPPPVTTIGTDAKKRVDMALERAGSAGKLLEQLLALKKEYDEKQDMNILTAAKNKLELYVNCILFTAFLKDFAAAPPPEDAPEDEEGGEEKAPTGLTFAKWRGENAEAVSLPGTVTSGEISDFLWD